MDIAKLIETQWVAISAARAAYIGTVVIIWLAATAFTRWRLGDEASAAKERSLYTSRIVLKNWKVIRENF